MRAAFLNAGLRVVLAAAFGLASSASAADTWAKVVGNGAMPVSDGFGTNGQPNTNVKGVEALEPFNGWLFAAAGQNHTGSGDLPAVWRTRDLIHWTNLGIGFAPGVGDIYYMTSNTNGIFLGTGNNSGGAQVWKSADGTTWSQFNGPGTGYNPTNNTVAMVGLQGNTVFVGTANPNGAQVWKRPADETANWTRMLDFATGLGTADGIQSGLASAFLYCPPDAPNVIFFSTMKLGSGQILSGGCFLYESADGGVTWKRNTAVGNGFGDTNNTDIAALVEFSGMLYAATGNKQEGGQLWRTALANATNWSSPTAWEQVVSGGFDSTNNSELHRILAAGGCLWVPLASGPRLEQVWRSADGAHWVQSNADGFAATNNAHGSYCALAAFTNCVGTAFMVWGGQWVNPANSNINAAQIWSTPIFPPNVSASCLTNSIFLSWGAQPFASYQLQCTTNLTPPASWQNFGNPLTATNLTLSTWDTPITNSQRFYRVQLPQ